MGFEDVYADVVSTSYAVGYYDSVNATYAGVLRSLLPNGLAWVFEEASSMIKLLTGMSYSFCRIAERANDLIEEIDPETTFELLEDWERVLALPGTCPTPPITLSGRRAAVHGKLLGNEDPAPDSFEALALSVGYTVTVISVPYHPFVAGSPVGDALSNNTSGGWSYDWMVLTDHGADDALLRWLLESQTPSHTQMDLVLRGSTFTERVNPKNLDLVGVRYGNGVWVAVGSADGVDAYIVRSTDAITWTEQANAKNLWLLSVAYGNGTWVAVGAADGADAYILTSPDGITWVERANPKNISLYGVFYAKGEFVAVGAADGADAYAVVSTDNGVTWSEAPNPKNLYLASIIYARGLWVAVGSADGVDAYIVRSSGVTFTECANPKNVGLDSIAFGRSFVDGIERFVAVGAADGVDAYIITSEDGITWTERANPKNKNLSCVSYIDGLWIAVGVADGVDAYAVASWDGITWVEWVNPKNFKLYGIGSNRANQFIAVGAADGTDAYIVSTEVR
jgi:uncharacterized protein YmfQ (DUF2313 family)